MQKEINQLDSTSVTSLDEMKEELEIKFKKLVKVELLPGDILHVVISEPTLKLEHIVKVVDILIHKKYQKYKNLSVATMDNIVVVQGK